jgi:hypothetical protein
MTDILLQAISKNAEDIFRLEKENETLKKELDNSAARVIELEIELESERDAVAMIRHLFYQQQKQNSNQP